MNRIINFFRPPEKWRVLVFFLLGIACGFCAYLFYISRAWSYGSDKSETCINCHIMAPQYATWIHSSHRSAVCNDCHVPHNNIFNKYYFKAKDGMRHATIFTLRIEPQVIYIKDAGKEVVKTNCLRCHSNLFASANIGNEQKKHIEQRNCLDCHRETPHGRVNSLSSVQNARVPLLTSPVPAWLNGIMQ